MDASEIERLEQVKKWVAAEIQEPQRGQLLTKLDELPASPGTRKNPLGTRFQFIPGDALGRGGKLKRRK